MDLNKTEDPELRILFVEDNKHDRVAFCRAFKDSRIPCDITEFERAEDALERLQPDESSFDIVITDQGLPGMSGLEFCKELLARKTKLPLVILTGKGTEQIASDALKSGVYDYIIKDNYDGYLKLLPITIAGVVNKHKEKQLRIKAEEQNKEWNNRYDAAVKASGQVLYDWDSKTNEIVYGGDLKGTFGYTTEEMEGGLARWVELIHPDDRDLFNKEIKHLIATRKPAFLEYRVRRKDGNYIFVEDSGHFFADAEWNASRMIGFVKDITRHKQSEMEINMKNAFLRLHQIAIVSANEAQEIEDAFKPILKGICSYTGWPIGHVYIVSRNDPDLLEPSAIWYVEDYRNFKRFCDITKVTEFKKERGLPGRVMASGKPHWIKDVTKDPDFPRASFAEEVGIKAGFAFPVLVKAKVVAVLEFFSTEAVESDNKLLEVVLNMGTQLGRVFERKRMEEEHIKMQKLESVGILAGGIAHDFNNSLQAILSTISVAKLYVNPEDEVYDKLTNAEKITMQSRDLSLQLLTFSRGGHPIKKVISAPELVKDSCKFATSGSNIRCEFNLPDCSCLVKVDKGQIIQVFNNLFINANQAMPEGGVIKINAEHYNVEKKDLLPLQEGRHVKITIKDQGIGIPPEYLPKIFDPYFTTKEMGSGLGLAITYSIIKKHNGYISVESEVGIGTTFHIYLPASKTEIQKENILDKAKVRSTEEASIMCKRKILFMDDEGIIRLSVAQQLRDIKYEVETTKDGTKATELYKGAMEKGKPFDAVILDLTISCGMGGKETIRKLLEIDPDVKAVVASGYSNDPVMTNFEEHGFKDAVAKPYEIEELDDALRGVIMEKS